jgi:hypothetical protein
MRLAQGGRFGVFLKLRVSVLSGQKQGLPGFLWGAIVRGAGCGCRRKIFVPPERPPEPPRHYLIFPPPPVQRLESTSLSRQSRSECDAWTVSPALSAS